MRSNVHSKNTTDFNLDALRAQQKALRHYGRLHWVHWCVLTLSVAVTLAAWHLSTSFLAERTKNRFEQESHRVINLIRVRLSHYEDALFAGVATLMSHDGEMSRAQWYDYAKTLDLPNKYPGINGIGVIKEASVHDLTAFEQKQRGTWPEFQVHPTHDFPLLMPIVYIEPIASNLAAIGLDIAFEKNRRTAALLARDLGISQISGPITLVQDDTKTPGFLFYAPYFRNVTGFESLVYAPLVVKNFIAGVLGDQERYVFITIKDGDKVIYDESPVVSDSNDTVLHRLTIEENFYGRDWQFTIGNTPAFVSNTDDIQPMLVLLSGLIIDALLLALFLMLTRSNQRVLNMAESMTGKLGEQSIVLSQKNEELESFAHVVSHDLKTPLLAIRNLTMFLEEDIDEYLDCETSKTLLSTHIERVNQQIARSQALIQGVLDFSVIGHETAALEEVDVGKLLTDISQSLSLSEHQLKVTAKMPTLRSYPIRLTQVFENLIGNAYKYHPSPETATITVSVSQEQAHYRFLISDDGQGIDQKYHERIFKPFTRLQQQNSAQSSGIGLSIVKKTIEHVGGAVGILPQKGPGVTFFIDWPTNHHDDESDWSYREAA